ncbi:MAG TPA: TonB-dependent receptor [Vicinamibacterales bacterium]|nr:TonB-dependent receptor [Vicinamibacterales bacterium]
MIAVALLLAAPAFHSARLPACTAAAVITCASVQQSHVVHVHGVIVDATGAAVTGADVRASASGASAHAVSAADGSWALSIDGLPPVEITVSLAGFQDVTRTVTNPDAEVRIQLVPQGITERVTVTGDAEQRLVVRSSATIVDRQTLADAPALALDEQLRVVPGFSLFRRTSSLVANPTAQGVTLRGMSASGASRTLVVADGVPLNDPFGAWVYWDRIPAAALDAVVVSRGAASDVHGNDALGGVIDINLRTAPGADVRIDGGNQGTSRVSAFGGASARNVLFGAAAESLRTDGYVVVAPESRGSIDVPAGVQARSALGWISVRSGPFQIDSRGGYFSEDRNNGTPAQVNATISRWGAATVRGSAAGGAWEARVDSTSTSYRQTFSAVNAARDAERLTSLQWVAASTTGAAVTWIRARTRTSVLLTASTRYWSADLEEASVAPSGATNPSVLTPAWQRSDEVAFQGRLDVSSRTALEAGARVEAFRSSLREPSAVTATAYAFDPRLAFSWQVTAGETVRVSWLSGFRGPTMNELYRSFRVGNAITLANAALDPERTWGPEAAFTSQRGAWTTRAIVYATKLSDAIYSRTLSSGATIMRQRSNAGARALGTELEAEWRATPGVSLSSSWAIGDSRFIAGDLDGKRIPQVPGVQGAIGARFSRARLNGAVDIRIFSSQFDDDVNAFKLRAGSVTAARLGWDATRHVDVFGAIENAFDADIDTGRTPIRTVGAPRTGRAGLRIRF